MLKFFFLVLVIIASPALAATDTSKAKLQVLNKINAQKHEVIVELDKAKTFQTLEIKLLRCRKSDDDERDEHLAMLEIDDLAGGSARQIFYGWMFSSSPAISALEHPIYDVIVLNCED